MAEPSEHDIAAAAQIWCEPQHSHKEMDVDFARSIAQAIAQARAEEREWIRQRLYGCENGGDIEDLQVILDQRDKEEAP